MANIRVLCKQTFNNAACVYVQFCHIVNSLEYSVPSSEHHLQHAGGFLHYVFWNQLLRKSVKFVSWKSLKLAVSETWVGWTLVKTNQMSPCFCLSAQKCGPSTILYLNSARTLLDAPENIRTSSYNGSQLYCRDKKQFPCNATRYI